MHLNPATARVALGCARSIAVAVLLWPLGVAAQPVSPSEFTGSAPTMAEQDSGSTQGVGMRLGFNSDYKKATLVYETPKLWGYKFQNGWGRVDLNIELGASYWEANGSHSDSMGQISAIPMLRWWPTERFYIELGSGPTLLSRSEFAGRDLSTNFQFGSHLGTGFLINKAHRIGILYSHYSNASIKKPNPGLDLLEVAYTYQF